MNCSLNFPSTQFLFDGSDINAPFYFWRNLEDEQLTGKIDITLPLGKRSSSVKIGGWYSNKERVSNQDEFRMSSGGATISMDSLGGDQNAFVQPNNVGVVGREEDGDFQIANFLFDNTNPADSYTGFERITAAYGMLNVDITEKLKFVGGARLETTEIETISRDTSERIGSIDEVDILPSANLIYEVIEDFNIRASYSKTIARPTLREISTFTIIEPLTRTFERGNPDLERSLIDNFDLRFEYFLGGNELISIGGYYKDFTDPIARIQLPVSPNNEFTYDNVADGYLLGIEFELRKKLNFISPALQNFSLVTNISYINSEISTDTPVDTELAIKERTFIGQPEYIINAAINFVEPDQGWDVALALNSIGDRITTIGSPSGSRRDIVSRARTQLDLIASKKFGNLKVRLGVLNILDDPFTESSEFFGEEYIFSDFRRGLDFRFNIGYTF